MNLVLFILVLINFSLQIFLLTFFLVRSKQHPQSIRFVLFTINTRINNFILSAELSTQQSISMTWFFSRKRHQTIINSELNGIYNRRKNFTSFEYFSIKLPFT